MILKQLIKNSSVLKKNKSRTLINKKLYNLYIIFSEF